MRETVTTLTAAIAAVTTLIALPAKAEYPERPVTIIVPWGAGGGTDTIIRIFAVGFEQAMGQPINVVNRTGGSGVVGHSAIANAGAGTDTVRFIPSKGGAPALQDLVAGGISMFTGSPIEARALADAGEVKILGIMSDERSPAFPDVPTLKESGIDWSLTNWFSLCAPSGLPADVKAKVEAAAKDAHGSAAVQDALGQRGITPVFDGSAAFSAFAADFSQDAKALLTDLGLAK